MYSHISHIITHFLCLICYYYGTRFICVPFYAFISEFLLKQRVRKVGITISRYMNLYYRILFIGYNQQKNSRPHLLNLCLHHDFNINNNTISHLPPSMLYIVPNQNKIITDHSVLCIWSSNKLPKSQNISPLKYIFLLKIVFVLYFSCVINHQQ